MCLLKEYPIGSTSTMRIMGLTCYHCGYVYDDDQVLTLKAIGHNELCGDLVDVFEYTIPTDCPSCGDTHKKALFLCPDGMHFYIDVEEKRELVEINRQ